LITEAKARQQTQPEGIRIPAEPARDRAVTRPRPKVTQGRTERIETPRGRVYVTVNEDEYGPCEVFVESLDVEAEATGRLVSLCLRSGVDPREVIEQLWRVQSREVALDRSADGTTVRVSTIAQAVALALGRALYGDGFRPDKEFPRAAALPEPTPRARQERLRFTASQTPGSPQAGSPAANGTGDLRFAGVCPDCGDKLVYENGCVNCRSCGYSRC
jgi:ribonucleoside-diphosphate reductase alpha chain